MEFHEYQTLYQWGKQSLTQNLIDTSSPQMFYNVCRSPQFDPNHDPVANCQYRSELSWLEAKRPYYLVYPAIIPTLVKLDLDLDSSLFSLPLEVLSIRLPKTQNPFTFEDHGPQAIRVIQACLNPYITHYGKPYSGMTLWIDIGERLEGIPIYVFRTFRQLKGMSVNQALDELAISGSMKEGLQVPESLIYSCVKLVLTLCLLGNDPELISPDVLSKDRNEFERSGDQKYVEKAIRKGKRGWVVGAGWEVMPHYRRPHLGLRWTGEGRTVPKIVPISGAVVKRHKVVDVPAGFQGTV